MIRKSITIFIGLLCLASIGVSVYFYLQNKKITANPQAAIEGENQAILKKIGSVMELPGELPTIITVVDREKLQDQEFFKKAANGDKVIMYEGARRLILYRPGTGKVIDVVPLAFTSPAAQESPVPLIIDTTAPAPVPEQPLE